MRFRHFALAVALLSPVVLVEPAHAAAVKPIVFARGAYSATVSGKWKNASDSQVFTLKVLPKQTIHAVGAKGTTIFIVDPKGNDVSDAAANCNSDKTVKPTMAGHYVITLSPCLKVDPVPKTYRMTVNVR